MLGVVSRESWQKSRKIPNKTTSVQGHWRSSNLAPIERTIRPIPLPISDRNFVYIFCTVSDLQRRKGRKSPFGYTRVSFINTIATRLIPCEYPMNLRPMQPKTRVNALPDTEELNHPTFVRFDIIPACDGRADRRTDRRSEMLQLSEDRSVGGRMWEKARIYKQRLSRV